MGFISYIRKSDKFLTAKGKLIDDIEWHALAAGLIASLFYYLPFKHAQEFSYLLMTGVATTALGIEAYRFKKKKDVSVDDVTPDVDSLKDQIEKEGQYSLLGLLLPHLFVLLLQITSNLITAL